MIYMAKMQGKITICVFMVVLLASALICAGCTTQQAGAKVGDTVNVTYTVKLEDGTVFESNANTTPLKVSIGSGMLIPGFDEALVGMNPGQTKTVTIPPEKAYGVHKSELVSEMNTLQGAENFWNLSESGKLQPYLKPGFDTTFIWARPDGNIGYVTFSNITDTTMTIDENHPLAGKTLIFEITLLDITGPGASTS